MNQSDVIASASLFTSLCALLMSYYAVWRGNKTTSAATMLTLVEAMRNAWTRFLTATEPDSKYVELAELLNLFEVASAILLEKSLSGNSAKLISEYLDEALRLLTEDAYAKTTVPSLLKDAGTFVFIKKVLSKRHPLSVTIPPAWFESQ